MEVKTKKERKIENQLANRYWNNVIVKDDELDPNPRFTDYYMRQFPHFEQEDWKSFRQILGTKLPSTFRTSVERYPLYARCVYKLFSKYSNCNGNQLTEYIWRPNSYRIPSDIMNPESPQYDNKANTVFRELLEREVVLGTVVRQEVVSMLPVLMLKNVVKSSDCLLDMCASPGSKTNQLLALLYEAMHRERTEGGAIPSSGLHPSGMVVGNDADTKRIHTIRRRFLNDASPNLVLTCSRAEDLYNHMATNGSTMTKFNHIVCDVPCSGDGTFRKSPHLWRNFRTRQGLTLHGVQLQIALAAIDVLSMNIGSRFVYSTCSINPLEDEAVVTAILRKHHSTLRLVKIRGNSEFNYLDGLVWRDGVSRWRVDVDVFVEEADNAEPSILDSEVGGKRKKSSLEERAKTISLLPKIEPSMQPPGDLDGDSDIIFPLDRCMRIFPHDQDTGGFFVAVFERYQCADVNGCKTQSNVHFNQEVQTLKNLGYNPKHSNTVNSSGDVDENSEKLVKWQRDTNAMKYSLLTQCAKGTDFGSSALMLGAGVLNDHSVYTINVVSERYLMCHLCSLVSYMRSVKNTLNSWTNSCGFVVQAGADILSYPQNNNGSIEGLDQSIRRHEVTFNGNYVQLLKSALKFLHVGNELVSAADISMRDLYYLLSQCIQAAKVNGNSLIYHLTEEDIVCFNDMHWFNSWPDGTTRILMCNAEIDKVSSLPASSGSKKRLSAYEKKQLKKFGARAPETTVGVPNSNLTGYSETVGVLGDRKGKSIIIKTSFERCCSLSDILNILLN